MRALHLERPGVPRMTKPPPLGRGSGALSRLPVNRGEQHRT
jgi:hypothetical protein